MRAMILQCVLALARIEGRTMLRVPGLGFVDSVRQQSPGHGPFPSRGGCRSICAAAASSLMHNFSIETTPKLSSRIDDHSSLLPSGTPIYIAAIPGSSVEVFARMLVYEILAPMIQGQVHLTSPLPSCSIPDFFLTCHPNVGT